MEAPILKIAQLRKSFNGNPALYGIDLEIARGRMYGLLGPNGAGKTTLIRIITRILEPDSGQVFFGGEPLADRHIARIGYMPEERGLYKKMKVGEQLLYLARLRNLSPREARERIDHWMNKLDIMSWKSKKVEELSKGMGQKVQFVATVMHGPELLILDEPFSGLDPVNSQIIQEEIAELNAAGTTVIFSTHRMEQVEEICEDIVLINRGSAVLEGTVRDIKESHKKHLYRILFEGEPGEPPPGFGLVEREGKTLTFRLEPGQNANSLIRALINNGTEIHGVTEILPSLHEIFIQHVGANAAAEPAL